jgi:hypothetical protein
MTLSRRTALSVWMATAIWLLLAGGADVYHRPGPEGLSSDGFSIMRGDYLMKRPYRDLPLGEVLSEPLLGGYAGECVASGLSSLARSIRAQYHQRGTRVLPLVAVSGWPLQGGSVGCGGGSSTSQSSRLLSERSWTSNLVAETVGLRTPTNPPMNWFMNLNALYLLYQGIGVVSKVPHKHPSRGKVLQQVSIILYFVFIHSPIVMGLVVPCSTQ